MQKGMNDEITPESLKNCHSPGHAPGSKTQPTPLQLRASFLENWNWKFVTDLNCGLCQGNKAQHGFRPENKETFKETWEKFRGKVVTFEETLDFLTAAHKEAPFLFFNGNTFAEIGRTLALIIFSDLPPSRRSIVVSSIAHYIAGVPEMDKMALTDILNSLTAPKTLTPGTKVQTLKKTLKGTIEKVLPDGRLKIVLDETNLTMIATPDSLLEIPAKKKKAGNDETEDGRSR